MDQYRQIQMRAAKDQQDAIKSQYPDGISLEEGIAAEEAGNWAIAGAGLRPLAEQGNPKAQTYLGLTMMKCGCTAGGPLEGTSTREWLEKAVAQGDVQAETALGKLWNNFSQYPEAFHWYSIAADHGSTEALVSLGFLYQNGTGATKDYTQAMRLYCQAAKRGNSQAHHYIEKLSEVQEQARHATIWGQGPCGEGACMQSCDS